MHDVSFEVKPGHTLGIMGMTGTGKTTIVSLLQRFYDVTDGRILLDGTDIRKIPLAQLRASLAVVMQEVFLFSDSVSENVRTGQREAITQETVEWAAERAGAGAFIDGLAEKYDTVIGERGVGLSGGQKQRISIARALAKKAPVLILDDATSALDMETEKQIQHNLKQSEDMTRIIIAHRISAVRDADEKRHLRQWSLKMLERAARGDAEGLYRAHWLLTDSLEIYCVMRDRYYFGPKKTIRAIEAQDPAGYALLEGALRDLSCLQKWTEYALQTTAHV